MIDDLDLLSTYVIYFVVAEGIISVLGLIGMVPLLNWVCDTFRVNYKAKLYIYLLVYCVFIYINPGSHSKESSQEDEGYYFKYLVYNRQRCLLCWLTYRNR
jgi:hypothetical protein